MISERSQRVIQAAQMRSVSRENPKLVGIPSWLQEYRQHQVKAVKEILDGFSQGRMVVVDAPTGSGKTLIAETVRRMLGARALYTCNSILLQEQVARDFPESSILYGRSNYIPELLVNKSNRDWITCADCTKSDDDGSCGYCSSVHSCPYEIAKSEGITHNLTILNTAYLLSEGNGPGRFKGRNLVICDEADTLESELMRYISVDISKRNCTKYGLSEPSKVTKPDAWRLWMDSAIPKLTSAKARIHGEDIRSQREYRYLDRLLVRLRIVREDIENGWVYTGKDGRVAFKPVSVEKWGKMLWGLGDRFLLMSATVISPGALLESLGWTESWTGVTVPSTFPKENRRVIVRPVGKVTRKNDTDGPRSLVGPLQQIIRRHSGQRVLVHCVSYRLAEYLYDQLSRSCKEAGVEVERYSNSDGKAGALDRFKSGGCSVLLAPSMDRGVDLPDDECRVIVIAKVPYPYLGDRQVSARLHSKGGQVWYTVQTVRSVVQMTGRAVRHKDDWCTSYILDSQFMDLWNKARGLFPSWWREGLVWNE